MAMKRRLGRKDELKGFLAFLEKQGPRTAAQVDPRDFLFSEKIHLVDEAIEWCRYSSLAASRIADEMPDDAAHGLSQEEFELHARRCGNAAYQEIDYDEYDLSVYLTNIYKGTSSALRSVTTS
jgi:hypothetical protein